MGGGPEGGHVIPFPNASMLGRGMGAEGTAGAGWGKGAPWESWAWDVRAWEGEGKGAPGVQMWERGWVGKWQGRPGGANAGRGPGGMF